MKNMQVKVAGLLKVMTYCYCHTLTELTMSEVYKVNNPLQMFEKNYVLL